MLEHPEKLQLGGERRRVTLFFSDLAGFTTISERLSAETVVSLLNDYLSAMTEIILDEEGTVDKFEGDAIMAFWGAPLDQAGPGRPGLPRRPEAAGGPEGSEPPVCRS